jgi:hypothetical protein
MMARFQPVRLGYPELVILGSPGAPDMSTTASNRTSPAMPQIALVGLVNLGRRRVVDLPGVVIDAAIHS